jgi:hypothetical protein
MDIHSPVSLRSYTRQIILLKLPSTPIPPPEDSCTWTRTSSHSTSLCATCPGCVTAVPHNSVEGRYSGKLTQVPKIYASSSYTSSAKVLVHKEEASWFMVLRTIGLLFSKHTKHALSWAGYALRQRQLVVAELLVSVEAAE